MAADALATEVARASAAVILNMYDKQVLAHGQDIWLYYFNDLWSLLLRKLTGD